MLRIADGLDRTHTAAVRDVRLRRSGDHLGVAVVPAGRASVELELWGAERKKGLLEEALGITIDFHRAQ